MKSPFILAMFWMASLNIYAQTTSTTKPRIKSVIEYAYNIPDKITSTHSTKWAVRFETHFDTAGRAIWETMLDKSENKEKDTTKFTYDNEGMMLKWYSKNYVVADYSYDHDKQGRIIITDKTKRGRIIRIIDKKNGIDTQYVRYNSGGIQIKRVNQYNTDNTIRRITEFDENGALTSRSIETYDDRQRRIDQVIFNNDGSRKSHETVKYEKDGFIRVDSNQMYIGGPPATVIGDKLTRFTYKYPKLDKYDNPLIISFLYDGKYVIAAVKKYEYY
ncbi:hypothetical protein ACFS5N_06400 [Mucilaginibacter ximonensis]|uniref:YD repeat-containing protein n=1 Tax=Mucilaginibacter ximonensis TaxID=538021 RepID=A0ABW5YAT1_9SPHI